MIFYTFLCFCKENFDSVTIKYVYVAKNNRKKLNLFKFCLQKKIKECIKVCVTQNNALVAQLDRASDYGSEGCEFESRRARHYNPLNERGGLCFKSGGLRTCEFVQFRLKILFRFDEILLTKSSLIVSP